MIDYKKYSEFLDKKTTDAWFFQEVPLSMCDKKINVLCGANGSGKSMSLRMFVEHFNHTNTKYVLYTGSREGEGEKWATPFQRDFNAYQRGVMSNFISEGEGRKDLFELWQSKVLIPALEKGEFYYVLLDEVDSGLSPDKIWTCLGGLINKIDKINAKFIITANQYEMIKCLRSRNTNIIWTPTLQYWNPKSYDEFETPYLWYCKEIYNRAHS